MLTRRFGDVAPVFQDPSPAPLSQPNSLDVTQLVNTFKHVSGFKWHAQLQPNLLELNADLNALDIVTGVDAVRQFAYGFGGPCPCPSSVPCAVVCSTAASCITTYGGAATCVKTCTGGDNAGDPCINTTHCPGGACGAGTCRDRCGRCE